MYKLHIGKTRLKFVENIFVWESWVKTSNLESYLSEDKLLVIDFWADWCGPCKALSPIIDELATEYADRANIGKCDVEENDDIAVRYKIRNVPTIVFVKNDKEVNRVVGAISKADLTSKIEDNL